MFAFLRPLAPVALLLLPLTAARAQITETPETVAPGHFLLEMDALSLTVDHESGSKFTAFGAASTFLTTGVTDNWDVQVGAELFLSQKFDAGGLTERHRGIGDVYFRTKWRFYQDTASGTSVALLPYVKMPTNTGGVGNKSVEGGLIVPWTTRLWGDFNLLAMAELDLTRNDADDGYDTFLYATATMSRTLTKRIGIYGEATWGKSSSGAPFEGQLGGGVTYAVSDNLWWDFAMYRGLSNGAPDWNHVLRLNISF